MKSILFKLKTRILLETCNIKPTPRFSSPFLLICNRDSKKIKSKVKEISTDVKKIFSKIKITSSSMVNITDLSCRYMAAPEITFLPSPVQGPNPHPFQQFASPLWDYLFMKCCAYYQCYINISWYITQAWNFLQDCMKSLKQCAASHKIIRYKSKLDQSLD